MTRGDDFWVYGRGRTRERRFAMAEEPKAQEVR